MVIEIEIVISTTGVVMWDTGGQNFKMVFKMVNSILKFFGLISDFSIISNKIPF